jgi:hypothetical protein
LPLEVSLLSGNQTGNPYQWPPGGTRPAYTNTRDPEFQSACPNPEHQDDNSPDYNTKVIHADQKIYIGSLIAGTGVLLQVDTAQMYIYHGRHEKIVSPAS